MPCTGCVITPGRVINQTDHLCAGLIGKRRRRHFGGCRRKGKRSSRQLRTTEVERRQREKDDQRERQEVAVKPAGLSVEG